jgi:hypothetical protein
VISINAERVMHGRFLLDVGVDPSRSNNKRRFERVTSINDGDIFIVE